MRWNGGGGIGDPLSRPADSVLQDVINGVVSVEAAAEVYGVVVEKGAVDEGKTKARRRALRNARLATEAAE